MSKVSKGYRTEIICPICSKSFKPKKWGSRGIQKYCSLICKYEAQRNKVELFCKNCGKGFKIIEAEIKRGRKFCSVKCAGINRSKTQEGKKNPHWKGGISNHVLGSGKNTARKGRYYEYIARKELEKEGFYVVRSAGSKGIWDLVAIKADSIVLVQSKVNRIPRIKEREAMEKFICPPNCIKQYWRFFGFGKWEIFTWDGIKWVKV